MERTFYWVYEIDKDREALAISTIDKKERAALWQDTMKNYLTDSLHDCGYTNKITSEQMEHLLMNLGATSARME